MPLKAKVLVNGQETEVELDEKQFMTTDQHNVVLQQTIQDRLARQRNAVRTELEKDEEFVAGLLKAKGFDPTMKPGDVPTDKVAELQKQLREAEVLPLQQKYSEAQQAVERIRQEQLVDRLTAAMIEAGVKPAVATRLAKVEAQAFGFDERTGSFAVKSGDGFAFATQATQDRPYKGVEEFAREWVGDKANADFLLDQRMRGPGIGGSGATGNVVQISRADARDFQKYQAAAAQAEKAGGTVQITD